MKKNNYIFIIVLGFLLLNFQQIEASTIKETYYENPIETRKFDDKAWEEAIGEIDYTPAAIKKKEKEDTSTTNGGTTNSRNNNRSRDFSPWNWDVGSGALSGFFKLLLLILCILFLAFVVYKLSGGSFAAPEKTKKKGATISTNVDIEKVEQNLHKSDMEILIENSLKEGNYMMAIRLYYLWAIKELSAKHYIKWKRDKTNRDYARELRKTDLHKPFRDVTRIFERVWYGNQKELDQPSYMQLQKKLQDFVNTIKIK